MRRETQNERYPNGQMTLINKFLAMDFSMLPEFTDCRKPTKQTARRPYISFHTGSAS
jgi:hypothetical protein